MTVPYHEYLRSGFPVEGIICRVPASSLLPFAYVGEHVSDDVAVAVLERVIRSIEKVKADGHVPGDWDRRLRWLTDVLAQVWKGRGAFPGPGSVLQYLGCEKGTAYQREVLEPMARGVGTRGSTCLTSWMDECGPRRAPTRPSYLGHVNDGPF